MCVYVFKIVDCYMNIIGDMQNEMDYLNHYNEFEYKHDFVKLMKYSYIYISMYTKYNYMYMCESINFYTNTFIKV